METIFKKGGNKQKPLNAEVAKKWKRFGKVKLNVINEYLNSPSAEEFNKFMESNLNALISGALFNEIKNIVSEKRKKLYSETQKRKKEAKRLQKEETKRLKRQEKERLKRQKEERKTLKRYWLSRDKKDGKIKFENKFFYKFLTIGEGENKIVYRISRDLQILESSEDYELIYDKESDPLSEIKDRLKKEEEKDSLTKAFDKLTITRTRNEKKNTYTYNCEIFNPENVDKKTASEYSFKKYAIFMVNKTKKLVSQIKTFKPKAFKLNVKGFLSSNEEEDFSKAVTLRIKEKNMNVSDSDVKNALLDEITDELNKYLISGIYFVETKFDIIFLPELKGGCSKNETRVLEMNGVKLLNPKSKDNNCAFYCFKKEFKAKGVKLCKTVCNQIRLKYGLNKNSKISVEKILEIAEKELDIKCSVLNTELDIFNKTESDVNLMLVKGHYMRVEGVRKICNHCGKPYINKHDLDSCRKRMVYLEGKRNKKYKSKRGDKKILGDEEKYIIHYDIETYKNDKFGNSIANCVGWSFYNFDKNAWEYKYSFGLDCLERFLDFLMSVKIQDTYKWVNAFNGSNFDHLFLINKAMSFRKIGLNKISPLKTPSGIIKAHVGRLTLVDISKHLQGTLKSVAKDFKCEVQKGEFDYNKNCFNIAENDKNDLLKYLEADVKCLVEISNKLHASSFKDYKISWIYFLSNSQFGYDLWMRSLGEKKDKIILNDNESEINIRKSIYGGRTQVHKKFFKSEKYEELITCDKITDEIYESVKDYVLDLDVCSLYPTAMSNFKYPVGKSEKVFEYVEGKLGIYNCSYKANRKLIVPAIPRRDENGSLKWDLEDGCGWYSSADIETAKKYGYTFQIIEGYVWNESEYVFSDYISQMYEGKKKAEKGSPSYLLYKLFMNSVYGKTIQKPRYEKTFYVSKESDWEQIYAGYTINEIDTTFKEEWIVVAERNEELRDECVSKPSHIGAFILGYSRKIMMEYFEKLGCLWDKEKQFYYTDTDSIQVSVENFNKSGIIIGKDLGDLSNDLGESKIIYGCWVSPKMYMLKYIKKIGKDEYKLCEHKVGKGVKKVGGIIPLNKNDFENMLKGEKIVVENKDMFKRYGYKVNGEDKKRNVETFSVRIDSIKKILNNKEFDGRNFKDLVSVPWGFQDF